MTLPCSGTVHLLSGVTTCALAQNTLKITVGCTVNAPDRAIPRRLNPICRPDCKVNRESGSDRQRKTHETQTQFTHKPNSSNNVFVPMLGILEKSVYCVCVVCAVCCVCVCPGKGRAGQEKRGEGKVDIIQKSQEKGTKRVNKRGGNMVTIVWTDTNHAGNFGKLVKTRTPFLARHGHPWTPKKSEKGNVSRRVVFTFFFRVSNVFRHEVRGVGS